MEEEERDVEWKDFEGMVAEIMESKKCEGISNCRMRKKRMEREGVGIKLGVEVIMD